MGPCAAAKDLAPGPNILKKGGAWGAVGPKSKKWAKAPAVKKGAILYFGRG